MNEDVLKRIEALNSEYEYWYEVFRREKDPVKKEEAKHRYMPLKDEALRLQTEIRIFPIPKYSYKQRGEMDLDHENKRLVVSQKRLHYEDIKAKYEKEAKQARDELLRTIADEEDQFLDSLVRQIEEDGMDVSKIRAIQDKRESAIESSDLESVVVDSVRRTSIAWKVASIYSGEAFVEDYRTEGAEVLKALDEEKEEEAEEKFKQIVTLYDKAAQATRLPSGAEYFRLEKERRISEWEPMKNARLRLARISKAKPLIMEIVRMKPGVRQADLHKIIKNYSGDVIWEAAYRLYEEGLIRRVTYGRSYQLFCDTEPQP